ncbi:MAG: GGDEF domain-containing protein [Candidatus Hydrogenedentes bacterium]|nr:GGDEF domain-containing protein [Candidatus Hydrogenedentota bacterium]
MTNAHDETTDPLTGLPTRRSFDSDLAAWVAQKRPSPEPLSLVIADVDLFGAINERHGRTGGDCVIAVLAKALQAEFSDAAKVYRFGGDALAVLLPDVEKEQAFLRMEQFRATFSEEQDIAIGDDIVSMTVTVSMGLAAHPDDGSKALELVNKANEALYRAKVSGRNKICLAREEKMVTKTRMEMGKLSKLFSEVSAPVIACWSGGRERPRRRTQVESLRESE